MIKALTKCLPQLAIYKAMCMSFGIHLHIPWGAMKNTDLYYPHLAQPDNSSGHINIPQVNVAAVFNIASLCINMAWAVY